MPTSGLIPRSAMVVAAMACAYLAARALQGGFGLGLFVPFLFAVALSAWIFGRNMGIAATVLTAAMSLSFVWPDSWTRALALAMYIAAAAGVTYLAGSIHNMSVRWEGTLSSIGDGVVVIDRGGCVRFLNPVAEGMTGWKAREARKRPIGEVVHMVNEKTGEPVPLPLKSLLEEGRIFRATWQKLLVSRDGQKVWVEESSSPIRDGKAEITGAILVMRDVTARREAQEQMAQSQKMEAVGRLASGAAGDLNGLLTVITGFSEMLRTDLEEGNHLRRFADEISLAANRAAGLTRQLQSLGQKQAGLLSTQDLSALVSGMETLLKRLLGPGIELVIVPDKGFVKVDPSQIEQVLVNLAMNSRDAMPSGGEFVIEISGLELEPGAEDRWPGLRPGSYVTLVVSDTGSGMDADTRAHIFDPFFTTKGPGKGLGLSMVYGIVQQSGGAINVYSQVGAGTIFEIFLPREKHAAVPAMPLPRAGKTKGSETILIADDDDGVRRLVHAVLASNGYRILEAIDGVEGWASFEAHRQEIDLVITDIVMPRMSGLEFGDRLHDLNADLPVLYISGFRDAPAGETPDARKRELLQKPFTPKLLLERVRELLDRPERVLMAGRGV